MASSLLQTGKSADVARRATSCAKRSTMRGTDERALVSAVAGRAPDRRLRAPRAAARRLIAQNGKNPRGYCRAGGSARGSAALPADRRCAGAGGADVSGGNDNGAFSLGHAAAAPRVRLPGARTVRQGDRDVRERAQNRAERSVGDALSDSGADGGEELLARRGARARRAVDSPRRSAPGPPGVAGAATRRQGRSGAGDSRGNRSHAQRRSRGVRRAGAGLRRGQSRRRRR